MTPMMHFNSDNSIFMTHFELQTPKIGPGEELSFTFTLRNLSRESLHLDVRYQIVFPSGEGNLISHTYKISSRKCPTGFLLYNQKHVFDEDLPPEDSFAPSSPRTLYFPGIRSLPGTLRILVNGQVLREADFQVLT